MRCKDKREKEENDGEWRWQDGSTMKWTGGGFLVAWSSGLVWSGRVYWPMGKRREDRNDAHTTLARSSIPSPVGQTVPELVRLGPFEGRAQGFRLVMATLGRWENSED